MTATTCTSSAKRSPPTSGNVSPTRFHNSVHNAPAGYWGVATGAMESSTSLCAYDWSFAAGLIEALAWVAVERQPVVLVAYDTPYPEPLRSVRPIAAVFGVAFVLCAGAHRPEHRHARRRRRSTGSQVCVCPRDSRALCEGVPAARSLPLLCALARAVPTDVAIDYLDGGSVRVAVGSP